MFSVTLDLNLLTPNKRSVGLAVERSYMSSLVILAVSVFEVSCG